MLPDIRALSHNQRSGVLFCAFIALWTTSLQMHADTGSRSLLENLRQTADFSSRTLFSEGEQWHVAAFGIDTHTVVNGTEGDVGTLTFQAYLLRADHLPRAGGLFEDEHDWALQWRIANFNYTGIGHGRFNVRIGHFELPFGLEQVEQTNGTLYQMNSSRALGLKADWGVSVNGVLPAWEYEIAYTLGEGNTLSGTDGGLWVGRLGSPSDRRLRIGVSFLNGEQQEPEAIHRERYGVDLRYQLGHGFSAAYEVAAGNDESVSVTHQLGQLSWQNKSEVVTGYTQWRRTSRALTESTDHQSELRLGIRYEPNLRWSASAEFAQDLEPFAQSPLNTTYSIQFRYRL